MTRLSAALAVALLASQVATPTRSIRGIVIKSGTAIEQPLLNARLELSGPAGMIIARTDVGGRFAFFNLPKGVYRLAITCDGFVREVYPKRIIVSDEQPSATIKFELDPAPTATGWVLDIYGEPIANVTIEALRRSYDVRGNPRMTRVATGITDDKGEYRIFWLDPGDYFFFATSTIPDDPTQPPLGLVTPTYSPGVNSPEAAKAVSLAIGREVRVDFRLRAAGAWKVRGQTMGPLGRSVAAAVTLTPPAQDPSLSRFNASTVAKGPNAGEFEMLKVPPGEYILMAKASYDGQQITSAQRITIPPVLIPPPQGYSVTLPLALPLSIDGRLYPESRDTSDLKGARVELISVDPDLPSPKLVTAQPDGQFTLKGVPFGSYVLELSNLPRDVYLKAARFGESDILDKPVTIDLKTAAIPLQVLLAADGGRLQVTAYATEAEVEAGATVVLVPEGKRREHREQYRVATSDDDGQVTFRGIPPGAYKMFAWKDPEPNAYLNADFIAQYDSLGTPVTIASGDNPAAGVRVIPKD